MRQCIERRVDGGVPRHRRRTRKVLNDVESMEGHLAERLIFFQTVKPPVVFDLNQAASSSRFQNHREPFGHALRRADTAQFMTACRTADVYQHDVADRIYGARFTPRESSRSSAASHFDGSLFPAEASKGTNRRPAAHQGQTPADLRARSSAVDKSR